MFANEQVKQWETRVQATFTEAQKSAQERARRIEAEARKAFELFGDRAQAEVKQLMAQAHESTRERWARLGGEMIRIGQRLQEMSKAPANPGAEAEAAVAQEAAKVAAAGGQPPPTPDVH